MLLNIYTEYHSNELMKWAEENGLAPPTEEEPGFIEAELSGDVGSIPALLENIILSQNPITRQNSNLRASIQNRVFTPFRDEIKKDLAEYLEENTSINLEGYINFRLRDYSGLVDLILYNAIKKYLN